MLNFEYILFFSKETGMTVIARQPIKKGDPIYHSYAREFTTTTFRRLILFSGNINDNSSRFDSTKVIFSVKR